MNNPDKGRPKKGEFLFRLFSVAHAKIIKLTRGKLLAGRTLVLTHRGARCGKVRDTPLMHFAGGDNHLIVASAGGAPNHPGWYHNLLNNPDTVIEVAGEQIAVTARDAGDARAKLWEKITASGPRFAGYEAKTDRTIPVMVLEPR